MAINLHVKQSAEAYSISVDFTSRLPTATTVASAVVAATGPDGTDQPTLIGTVVVATPVVRVPLTALAYAQQRFYVNLVATLSNGNILEEDVAVLIREK
jgi:hypothetical protein